MDRRDELAGWLLAGLGGVAGAFAAAGAGPGLLVTPIEGGLARTMPGPIVSVAILLLGGLGQQLNLAVAVGLSGALLGLAGAAGGYAGATLANVVRTRVGSAGGGNLPAFAGAGVTPWVLSTLLTGQPIESFGAGLGVAVVTIAAGLPTRVEAISQSRVTATARVPPGDATAGEPVHDATADEPTHDTTADEPTQDTTADELTHDTTAAEPVHDAQADGGRRSLVRALGAALGLTAIGLPLGLFRGPRSAAQPTGGGATYDVSEYLTEAEEKSLDVRGLEPLVSEEFYQVDINAVDPTVDVETFEFSIEGAVETPLTATVVDLKADFPVEHRLVTLRCVGERLNGKKMDTAVWTGVPVDAILDRVEPTAESLVLRAEDGYFVGFPLEALGGGLLAYGMNGRPLPRGHGAPLRALVPGHWGEVNTKWLSTVEVVDEPVTGYWEQRGWHGTGPVNTVAKLHAVDRSSGRITVGGHAYAGTRGIDRVEVSTDGGSTWTDATLSEPLPGADVWRQWSHTYDAPGSRHEVVVRATDGTGTLQPRDRSDAFPSGPTGWVSETIRG